MATGKRVMVGMSGGVDSSVAAYLLQQEGYEVAGATFRLWSRDEADTPDILDARAVCRVLGISHHVLDWREAFRREVVEPFCAAYQRGETPNPCVTCNKHIKFGLFQTMAAVLGYDHIATGHYASMEYDEATRRFRLRRGIFEHKDQSYVLYNIRRENLSRVRFPLGGYAKEEVRSLAAARGLPVAHKADSQDICFIPDGDYAGFLRDYTGKAFAPGNFLDADGNILGVHRGICRYTIGQRKGLGISLGKPAFVTAINAATNTVTLDDDESLWKHTLTARQVNWLEPPVDGGPFPCRVKIRYNHQPQPATVTPLPGDAVRVDFAQPQRAITPGQSAVFYDGDYLLGGGVIIGN
jgi:tRNA-specific 2-thiouridylase